MAPCGPLYFGCESPHARRPYNLRGGSLSLERSLERELGQAQSHHDFTALHSRLERRSNKARPLRPLSRPGPSYFCTKIRDLHIDRNFPDRTESNFSECNSHSPVYLPKQACNAVSPSRLLLHSPGHFVYRGFFMHPWPKTVPALRAPHLRLAGSAPKIAALSHGLRLPFVPATKRLLPGPF